MPSRACTSSGTCGNHAVAETKTECKEFVVIGNGPSGIAVSYLLAGHWPYYTGQTRDEFLHTRLALNPELSLVEQDLEFLSDGLEGRSNNPVSLLLDALQNPDADIGLEEPSLLEWRKVEAGKVDHVVLGRGKPGGIWQSLDGGLLTVSLGGWMELPNLTMEAWRLATAGQDGPQPPTQRIDGASLARYYPDYVAAMGLEDNFLDNTVVTLVRQVQGDEAVGEVKPAKMEAKMEAIQEQEPVVAEILVAEEVFSFDVDESASDDLSSRCSSMTGPQKENRTIYVGVRDWCLL